MGNQFISCKHCQSNYELHFDRLNWRDKDKIDCEVCGHELFSWNEAKSYTAKLIERGSTNKPIP